MLLRKVFSFRRSFLALVLSGLIAIPLLLFSIPLLQSIISKQHPLDLRLYFEIAFGYMAMYQLFNF
jgi:predicted MFS family arabinose efflux permease